MYTRPFLEDGLPGRDVSSWVVVSSENVVADVLGERAVNHGRTRQELETVGRASRAGRPTVLQRPLSDGVHRLTQLEILETACLAHAASLRHVTHELRCETRNGIVFRVG